MKKASSLAAAFFSLFFLLPEITWAQQYKITQVTTVMGMKSTSTVYVKGMRKRIEGVAIMGVGGDVATIEQCDLKRTVYLNDKKSMYYIEPFSTDYEDKTSKQPVTKEKKPIEKGGVINIWYGVHDSGERKNMFGFVARHIWITQKIKPTPDACTMKDSMKMKIDGWYIDLPELICPMNYNPGTGSPVEPGCTDKLVTHNTGKGKPGFPLTQTMVMTMGDGTSMETTLETIELSTVKLDQSLFEIPPGYMKANSYEDLMGRINYEELTREVETNEAEYHAILSAIKAPGVVRIGVLVPEGSTEVNKREIQGHMSDILSSGDVEAITVSSEAEAKKYNCDYTLTTMFTEIKPGTKAGGILKAIRNADPDAAAACTVKATLTLKTLKDGTVKTNRQIHDKYQGGINEATRKAVGEACRQILKVVQ